MNHLIRRNLIENSESFPKELKFHVTIQSDFDLNTNDIQVFLVLVNACRFFEVDINCNLQYAKNIKFL